MTQPFVSTLITGSAMVLGLANPAVSAIDLSGFMVKAQPSPMVQRARPNRSGSSIIPWVDETPSHTAMSSEIWTNTALRLGSNLDLAFAQCKIDLTKGKTVFEAAWDILQARRVPVADIQIRVVVDPEDELHMTEVSFMVNDTFDVAMRLDRQLTRQLVKEAHIPSNLTVTVRETVEEFA